MPSAVGCSAKCVTHFRFGSAGVESRLGRSPLPGALDVRLRGRRSRHSTTVSAAKAAATRTSPRSESRLACVHIGQESATKCWVNTMRFNGCVDGARVLQVPARYQVLVPAVQRLRGESKHPAGQLLRESCGGRNSDQRVGHFSRAAGAKYDIERLMFSFSIGKRHLSHRNPTNLDVVMTSRLPQVTSARRFHRRTIS